jgi:short-subunit dehydrogenase
MVLLLRFLNGPAIYAPWRQWGMYSLDRKVAIVTGASEGIGAELARLLRSKGCRLVLAARNEAKLRAAAGPDSCVVPGDLTGEAVRVRVIEAALERFGRIDILINNAGRGLYGSASTTPLGEARDLFELNFFAPFHLAQLASPALRLSQGVIVNVSSIAGQISLPWLPMYSATKFALASLSSSQRIELRRYGVRVMSVFPGYVNTAFQDHAAGAPPPPGIVKGRRFAISAQGCAEAIVAGLEQGRNTVVTPRSGWLLVWVNRLFPGLVESRMERA